MMGFFDFIQNLFGGLFKTKGDIKLGLYGPPNAGKTTLANSICKDILGEEMGSASNIAHETREIQVKEQICIKSKDGKKELMFFRKLSKRQKRKLTSMINSLLLKYISNF